MPLDRLRDAVREASARTSYHVVADRIGISWPWVKNFLGGTKPHRSTLQKPNLWYVRYQSEAGRKISTSSPGRRWWGSS